METVFIKKTIKSADDLPKETGCYSVHLKGKSDYYWENMELLHYEKGDNSYWMTLVNWYLLPEPQIKELIKAQQELIDFYEKNISDNSVFLQMHHIGASLEDCDKGKELRTRIEILRKEVEYEL